MSKIIVHMNVNRDFGEMNAHKDNNTHGMRTRGAELHGVHPTIKRVYLSTIYHTA